ncbi:acetylxylan esterase [Kitasatospora phosalacinea]|uniref:Acetylxylan esterase n=1 Tax=Kitasatospora phosalacinea TaxID=2065 RepID=A0A9W6Q958_9ACTN|nr:acetylxylan esterase [Kitasatospora phosalacinea]GLW70839.1 acetylxylan esterase [Kitasatospora phosalacinea]
MPLTDLTLDECLAYRPQLPEPADLDAFWQRTLAEAGPAVERPALTPAPNGLALVDSYDLTVPGFGGHPVHGRLHLPAEASGPLGCVVEYLGYGRGAGLPHENLTYACAGYAHLIMDTRGQGWSAAPGRTDDPAAQPAGAVPGFLTRGLDRPDDYYYRRVYTDAVRFLAAARTLPQVDPDRIAVTGTSQGGGISLAAAALTDAPLAGVLPDVPFLCDFPRGVRTAARPPYTEIAEYLRLHRDRTTRTFATLAYFDAALLATRIQAPALFSIAMMDPICPPSGCFAAYHAHPGEKALRVYEFNGHEGGGEVHLAAKLAWLRGRIG